MGEKGGLQLEGAVASFGAYSPPPYYDRAPEYDKMVWERDVMIAMRDGVRVCADIYRPDAEGALPALLACTPHNKDMQTPDVPGTDSTLAQCMKRGV